LKTAIVATLTCLLITAAAYAQGAPPLGPPPGPHGEFGHPFGMHAGKVIAGAPYSADMSNVSVQTLADGNTIQRTTTGHVARDSQGRTYEQITVTGGPLGEKGPVTMTFITDPVAGYAYALNSNTKVATRHALKTPRAGTNSWQGPRGPRGDESSDANRVEKDLGTQNVNGVTAQGKSIARTIPAGAIGNAQPIVSTSERWYSPDLQIPVSAKNNDPRFGESTYSLTNIRRSEPPSSLFQVPSDYTIKDGPAHGPHGGPPPPQ
jgi:hypothetical protein